ncbi:hypothetical protein ACFQ5D_09190 [Paenibacillus farraposensis]|uniref:Uncharacterized protein n=1 Tax=Paenibacillus farraposensis TaxID=2807095 RepID=A0ABW4DAQ6_9BACL|nr:hypothetical protein [Paenibacillus farraposensis]MCC3379906.1 hypothetical protein [Paenibacillus farraposensis]
MNIEALGKIRHSGEDFAIGDILRGLSDAEAQRLVSLGSGKMVMDENHGSEGGNPGLLQSTGAPISAEEFAKLKADEQKELLESLEFEAAGNVEGRVEQYTAWLDENNALV